MGLIVVLLLGGVPWQAPLRADDAATDDALQKQVGQWIADLRSSEFSVREAAREALKKALPKARAWIEAAADDPDPEVRRTLRTLLGPARIPRPTPTVVGDFSNLLRVSFDYAGRPAGEVFADFGRKFGGAFLLPDKRRDVAVTAKAENLAYFAGLRKLLDAAGLEMTASFNRAGVAELSVPDADQRTRVPETAAGPLLVRVVSRQTTVQFGAPAPPPAYALRLELWWPPGVQVRQMRSILVEVARDEHGNAFSAVRNRTSYGLGQGTFMRTMDVTLHPRDDNHGDKLAALELAVPMRLQHGRKSRSTEKTADLPLILNTKGVAQDTLRGDGTVAFRSLEPQEGNARTWIADVAAILPEDVARQSAQVSLETSDGRELAMYLATGRSESADGVLHLTARAWNVGDQRPKRLTLHWFTIEDEGQVRIRFENLALK